MCLSNSAFPWVPTVLLLFIDLLLYSHKADRQGILNKNERKVIYYPLGLIVHQQNYRFSVSDKHVDIKFGTHEAFHE